MDCSVLVTAVEKYKQNNNSFFHQLPVEQRLTLMWTENRGLYFTYFLKNINRTTIPSFTSCQWNRQAHAHMYRESKCNSQLGNKSDQLPVISNTTYNYWQPFWSTFVNKIREISFGWIFSNPVSGRSGRVSGRSSHGLLHYCHSQCSSSDAQNKEKASEKFLCWLFCWLSCIFEIHFHP